MKTLLLVLLLIAIACQEEESEVLRQGKKTTPPPSHIYGDVTTIDSDDNSQTRFVFRITQDHNNEITEVLVRSVDLKGDPHNDSSSNGLGCIDKFDEPSHIVDKKSKLNVVEKNKNTSDGEVEFYIVTKDSLDGTIVGFQYRYITTTYQTEYRFNQKNKIGKTHKTTDNIISYFSTGDSVEFCKDPSPSGNGTNSP